MPRVIVFDVNETLLDLRALDPEFERVFGEDGARREWFQQVLLSAFATTLSGAYATFAAIADAALQMVAAVREVEVVEEERTRILAGMRRLPPHEDVAESLHRLRSAGLRLAALTNSPAEVAHAQLAHAGLHDYFEQILSVDAIKRFKPAPEPYRYAAERFGVGPEGIRLVAAHAWDIAGALRAGCAAAYVARPGMTYDPLAPRPDIVGMDMRDTVHQILRAEGVAHGS